MLIFRRSRKAGVTPFFVKKKNDLIRLILDAREANQYFLDPSNPRMGSASALGDLHVPEGEEMFLGYVRFERRFLWHGDS